MKTAELIKTPKDCPENWQTEPHLRFLFDNRVKTHPSKAISCIATQKIEIKPVIVKKNIFVSFTHISIFDEIINNKKDKV